MAKSFITIASIMLFTFHNCTAQDIVVDNIKEVWIYDSFSPKGYTRGELYRKFHELEQSHVTKYKLDATLIDSLKRVLIHAKYKKIRHGKCGTNLIFAQFVMKNHDSRNIIIGTNGIFDYHIELKGFFFEGSMKNGYWIGHYNKIKELIQ